MRISRGFMAGVWAAAALGGCGDSGRGNDDATASGGLTTMIGGTPGTTAVEPTTGPSSQTGSDAGTMSASQGTTEVAPTTGGTEVATGTGTTMSIDTGPGTSTGPDTTDGTTGDPCGAGGRGGTFDFSYLWVANTDQGSISKVNTSTLIEEARYYSDPVMAAAADPSRTSVNIDGHFVVVSNRGAGTVTKVAADPGDCIDKNGNGVIETSKSKDELLPWGSDECVLWNTQVNAPFSVGSGPRATAWAPGTFNPATCKFEQQKVWIGWLKGPGQAVIGRLDGAVGTLEAQVDLPGWPLTADAANGYAPYGAAADAQGYIWTTAVFSPLAYRIDPVTLEVKVWQSPNADSHYGMTVDGKGRVWFANWQGHGGVSMFDPVTETWHLVEGSQGNIHRGIAVDPAGMVWVASNGGGTNGCGVLQVSGDSLAPVTFHMFPQCGAPVGLSVDVEDMVWMVDYNGWAYRIDPVTYEKTLVPIANVHYTYSDMTGGGLVNAVMPG